MTTSSYRKTYIPHTELKTRTSLQYHYSWNTCENDLAVPLEPANPHHKGQNQIACKSPCLVIVSQYASNVDQLTDPNSFSTCMMNASTFLQWFITYELTRNQWWWSSFPDVLLVSYSLIYFLHFIQLSQPSLYFSKITQPQYRLSLPLCRQIYTINTTSQYLD